MKGRRGSDEENLKSALDKYEAQPKILIYLILSLLFNNTIFVSEGTWYLTLADSFCNWLFRDPKTKKNQTKKLKQSFNLRCIFVFQDTYDPDTQIRYKNI